MKIIADQNILFVKEAFAQLGTVTELASYKISRDELKDADIALVRSVTPVGKELLDGTSVRFVASATIGIDHIDVAYLKENHIGFAHAPGSNADSVAEYVLAAIIKSTGKRASELAGMKLAIVGVGNVGSKVCRIASALGIQCLLNDPPKKRLTGSDSYVSIDEALGEADIVSLHVPLTMAGPDATYHMVNGEFISKVKKGAILINSSRGKVIDEKTFLESRDSFGAVVLDVWEKEPAINTDTVRIVDIATPHIAGYSFDGKIRGTEMIQNAASAFYFHKQGWTVKEEETSLIGKTLDLRDSKDPIAEAVENAYDIMQDDEQFRKILSISKELQPTFFEESRKNYPRRYEFPHYKVILSGKQAIEADILLKLRFVVEQSDKVVDGK